MKKALSMVTAMSALLAAEAVTVTPAEADEALINPGMGLTPAFADWRFVSEAKTPGVCVGRVTKSGKLEAEVHASLAAGSWTGVLPVGKSSVLVKARAEVTLDNPHSDEVGDGVTMRVTMGGKTHDVAYSDYIEGVVTVRSFEDELPVPDGCTQALVTFDCGRRQLTARIFEIACTPQERPAARRATQTFVKKTPPDRVWPEPDVSAPPTAPVHTYANGARDPYESLKGVELIGTVPVRHSRDIRESPVSIGYEVLDRCSFDPRWTFKFAGLAGAKHARIVSGWNRCERVKGRYDFDWLDEVVDGLAGEGVKGWLCCSYGNALYTPCEKFATQVADCKARGVMVPGWARAYVGEAPYLHGPEAERGWLAYVRAMARHFKGRVKVWELWNEPEGFWRKDHERKPFAEGARAFARFVRESAAVIREEIPDAKIAIDFAALSSAWLPLLAREGVADDLDVFMFHGYEPFPESGFRAAVEQVRALLVRKDGRPLEFWQGESGRATGSANNGITLPTQYGQARFIARRITNDVREGMRVSNIFTITDFIKYYPDGRDQYYGVIDGITHKPKEGFRTLQAMGWLCDGLRAEPKHFIHFHACARKTFCDMIPYANVRTASFVRKGVPVLALWQAQHVELNAEPLFGTAEISFASGENELTDPILIDPVRCKVWDVRAHLRESPRKIGLFEFDGIWALDYPLFLTDRAALDM